MRSFQGIEPEPRICIEPASISSDGDDAVMVARTYYIEPFPWQAAILKTWLSRNDNGEWAAPRCGLLVARQNGKNVVAIMRELYGALVLGETILHTAHLANTARKDFATLLEIIEHPDIAPRVRKKYESPGRESIEFKNGGSIRFVSRGKRGMGRGLSADLLILDECQQMDDEMLDSMLPCLSAAPLGNPQLIALGTPPSENVTGEVFKRMREEALSGESDGLAWHEWSIQDVPEEITEQIIRSCNPSLGLLLSMRTVKDEQAQMSNEGFIRERLSYWSSRAMKATIPSIVWGRAATDSPSKDGVRSYGIKFSSNSPNVSLAVCVKPENGAPHVELVEVYSLNDGIGALVDWLLSRWEKCAQIGIDGMQGAPMLKQALISARVPQKMVCTLNARDVITACSMFMDALNAGTVTHFDQEPVNRAVANARRRNIGRDGGWGFGAIGNEDVSPLEACAIAYWAAMTTKRKPTKGRVG